jgi:hypothetical protein
MCFICLFYYQTGIYISLIQLVAIDVKMLKNIYLKKISDVFSCRTVAPIMLKVDNNDNLNLKFSMRNFGEFKKKMLIFHIQKQNHFIFVSCENNFVYFFIIKCFNFFN